MRSSRDWPRFALASLKDFYAAFTRKTFVVGDGEEARYLKLVLNSLVGGTSALLAEALAMGRKGGLGNAAMMDVICESAVASPLLQYKRDMVVDGSYAPAFAVNQIMKGLDIIGRFPGRIIARCHLPPRSGSNMRLRS